MEYIKDNIIRIIIYSIIYICVWVTLFEKGSGAAFGLSMCMMTFGLLWYEAEVYGLKTKLQLYKDYRRNKIAQSSPDSNDTTEK